MANNPFGNPTAQSRPMASSNPFLTEPMDELDRAFAEIDFGDLKFNSSGGLSNSASSVPINNYSASAPKPMPRLEHTNSDSSLNRSSPYAISLVEPGARKSYNPNLVLPGSQSNPSTRQSSPNTPPHFQSNSVPFNQSPQVNQPNQPTSNYQQIPAAVKTSQSVPSTPTFANPLSPPNTESPGNQRRQPPPPTPKPQAPMARFAPSPTVPAKQSSVPPSFSSPPPSNSPTLSHSNSFNQNQPPPPPSYTRPTQPSPVASVAAPQPSPSQSAHLIDSSAIENCRQCGSPIAYTPHPTKTVKVRCYNCPNINYFGGDEDSLLQFQRDQKDKLNRAMSDSSLGADNDSEGSGRNSEDTEEYDDGNSESSNGSKKKGGLTLRSFTNAAKQANKNIRAKAVETKSKVANSNFVHSTKVAAAAAANKTKMAAGRAADATKGAASKASNYFASKEDAEEEAPPQAAAQPAPPPLFNPQTAIFKMPIQKVVERSAFTNPNVPEIVTKCIGYLDKSGYKEEGIFRISGSLQAIKNLREAFDRGEDVDISAVKDEHVVSGLLKLWFRELPDLIFTNCDIDPYCLDVENVDTVKEMIYNLPIPNYTILGVLFGLLDKVRNHTEYNKMTIHNLAIVFSPTLQCSTEAVTFILSHYHYIFDIPNDLLFW